MSLVKILFCSLIYASLACFGNDKNTLQFYENLFCNLCVHDMFHWSEAQKKSELLFLGIKGQKKAVNHYSFGPCKVLRSSAARAHVLNQTKKVLREPTFLIKKRRRAFNIGYKTAWNMLRHALILKGYLRVKIIIFQRWRSNWKVLTLLILS